MASYFEEEETNTRLHLPDCTQKSDTQGHTISEVHNQAPLQNMVRWGRVCVGSLNP